MAYGQRLHGQKLAAARDRQRQPLLNQAEVTQPETVEQAGDPGGERSMNLLKIAADAELTGLHPLVDRGSLLHQQTADQGKRQNDQQQDDGDGAECGQRAALFEPAQQHTVKRCKQQHQYRSPEHRPVKRPQHPDKSNRDGDQQKKKGSVFKTGGAGGSGKFHGYQV